MEIWSRLSDFDQTAIYAVKLSLFLDSSQVHLGARKCKTNHSQTNERRSCAGSSVVLNSCNFDQIGTEVEKYEVCMQSYRNWRHLSR